MNCITSASNPRIKRLRSLFKDKKMRAQECVFVGEGYNFVKDIPKEGWVKELYIQRSKYSVYSELEQYFGVEACVVEDRVFDSVSDTVTPSGVIAVIAVPLAPSEIEGDTVMVLDGVSDAGNVGTIIRTACAFGIKNVVCINTASPYSPKVVRAAMSGILRVMVHETDTNSALKLLSGYSIVSLDMGGKCIRGYKNEGKTAIVVGNEAHGVSREIKDASTDIVSIPMVEDSVESLNAGIAAAVAMYALGRF